MQDGIDLLPPRRHRSLRRGGSYEFFVSETTPPSANLIDRLATVYLQNGTRLAPVLQSLLTSAEFQSPSVYFTRYSWPVEFVVKSMKEAGWGNFSLARTLTPLVSMGQQLFEPPDVAGWSLGQSWFSTGAMLTRMNFASTLALDQKFRLADAAAEAKESPQALVNYMLSRLTAAEMSGPLRRPVAYASAGSAWTGSPAQLDQNPGLAHLILDRRCPFL